MAAQTTVLPVFLYGVTHPFRMPGDSDRQNWARSQGPILDFASSLDKDNDRQNGLLGLILTDEQFAPVNNGQVFARLVDPGPGLAVRVLKKAFDQQQRVIDHFKTTLLNFYPEDLYEILRGGEFVRFNNLDLRELYQLLFRTLGTLTAKELEANIATGTKPYDPRTQTFSQFTAVHVLMNRRAHDNRQAIPPASQVSAIKAALLAGDPRFQSAVDAYTRDPLTASPLQQTFANFIAAMTLTANTLDALTTSSSMDYASSVFSSIKTYEDGLQEGAILGLANAAVSPRPKNYEDGLRDSVRNGSGRGSGRHDGRGRNDGRGRGRESGRGGRSVRPLHYCYVHGSCGHAGAMCNTMLADPHYYTAPYLAASHPTAMPGGSTKSRSVSQHGRAFNDVAFNAFNNAKVNTRHHRYARLVAPLSFVDINSSALPANPDTGATGHFMSIASRDKLLNVHPTSSGIWVTFPNGTRQQATHTAELDIPQLPRSARIAHLFPTFPSGALLSIGVLCDHGLTATYTSDKVVVSDASGNNVLEGGRSPVTRLWEIDLINDATKSTHSAANVVHNENNARMVAFYHASFGSPALSTFIKAADNGFLTSCPGLTSEVIRKNKPNPIAMSKGHLDQTRMNARSTSVSTPIDAIPLHTTATETTEVIDVSEDLEFSFPPHNSMPTQEVYTRWERMTSRNYMDKTGRFPIRSRSGNEYVLIMYSFDGNYIHAEPTADASEKELVAAYQRGYDFFNKHGFAPKFERLDNEAPKRLRDYMTTMKIQFQLAPPHSHRRNAAERAIRTFKNHFISILCTTDPDFPLNLWDKLLPHAECTLNLLRGSRITPNISAWVQLHGQFNFDATPLAPAGTRVLIHEKPDQRPSWAPHGVDGFYIGPAPSHYRCYTVCVKDTGAVRITDTVAWHPVAYNMPGSSPLEVLSLNIRDLIATLSLLRDSPVPFAHQLLNPLLPSLADVHRSLVGIFSPNQAPSAAPRLPLVDPQIVQSLLIPAAQRTEPAVRATVVSAPAPLVSLPVAVQRVEEQRVADTAPPQRVATPAISVAVQLGGDNVTFTTLWHERRRRHKKPTTQPANPTPTMPTPLVAMPAALPQPSVAIAVPEATPPPPPASPLHQPAPSLATHIGPNIVDSIVAHSGDAKS